MLAPTDREEENFVAALLRRLPPYVRVGAHDWRIILWPANKAIGEARNGECCSAMQEIRIQESLPTRYTAVDVVLHEITHAVYWGTSLDDKDEEERIVESISMGLTGLFRDNPWLPDWIKSANL